MVVCSRALNEMVGVPGAVVPVGSVTREGLEAENNDGEFVDMAGNAGDNDAEDEDMDDMELLGDIVDEND